MKTKDYQTTGLRDYGTTDRGSRITDHASRIAHHASRSTPIASRPALDFGLWTLDFSAAFTLIELIVVISIIALLAALILPVAGVVNEKKIRKRAFNELAELETIIESYKARLGFYPPADATSPATNSLYFELLGTRLTNNTYVTLDGSAQIPAAAVSATFGAGVGGMLNCSRGGGGDESQSGARFLKAPRASQFIVLNGQPYAVLGTALDGPITIPDSLGRKLNPWRYRSPGTNNLNSFDLWTVVQVGGKWNTICNWTKTPLVINNPNNPVGP